MYMQDVVIKMTNNSKFGFRSYIFVITTFHVKIEQPYFLI